MALVNAPRVLRLSSSGRYPSKSKSDCILGSSAPKLPMSKRSMVVLLILSLILLVLHSIYPYRKSPFLATHTLPPEHTAPANLQVPQNPGLQNVLVHLATVDLGERVMAQQVSVLLDEAWKPSLADQLLDSIQLGRDERELLEGTRSKLAKEGHSIPAQLLNPWYARRWGQISNSVRSWVDGRRVYDPHIMFSVLRAVKDRIDKHYIKLAGDYNAESVELGKPYRSCAVVGNSGILLNSNYSSLIDSHQAVIRLNNARTAGFEQHVGGKTTLAFINSNLLQACAGRSRCFCQPYGDHVPILLYMCHPAHFMDLTLCSESQKAPILVTDPRLDTLCARIAKYYSLRVFVETTGRRPDEWSDARDGPFFHYSSGMQAVLVALGFCRQVSLFGFGKSPGAKHHYHTNQQSELHLHDYAAEYQLYHDLQHNTSLVPFLSESGFSLPPLHVYS